MVCAINESKIYDIVSRLSNKSLPLLSVFGSKVPHMLATAMNWIAKSWIDRFHFSGPMS